MKIGVNALLVLRFFTFFYFGPLVFFLPLLVPKTINAPHFSPYRQPLIGNADVADGKNCKSF